MNFQTSCFVRVENPDVRKELIKWLDNIGYLLNCSHDEEYKFVVALNDTKLNLIGIYACLNSSVFLGSSRAIDCGENIELFKALAAINDENDREQWFVAHAVTRFDRLKDTVQTEKGERLIMAGDWFKVLIPCANDIRAKWMSFGRPNQLCHKATKDEIVEHFKNQKA